jgi:uncharacterized protein YprB with RNaseH-like and TPR domain
LSKRTGGNPRILGGRLLALKSARGRGEPPAPRGRLEDPEGEARFAVGAAEGWGLGPGWVEVAPLILGRTLGFENPLRGRDVSPLLVPPEISLEELLFFDTETTGLSGGAGTLAFLVGLAWIEDGQLRVQQLFLRDFPGEGEFLTELADRLSRHRLFVSFNGRAFDAHILRNRFLLNGRPFELEHQNDLLYWARRLWRRTLGDCSLGNIEREILGVHRLQDVAGFEVPGIYLEYLRTSRLGRLPLVMEHNLQDVLSLVRLFDVVAGLLAEGRPGEGLRTDTTTLGRFLLDRGYGRGLELLERAFQGRDEAAGRLLSLHYKRQGQWERAVEVWGRILEERRSLFAAVEMAKYLEHRRRRHEEALEWVLRVFSWGLPLDPLTRRELERRRERLQRKARGGSS